jgi:hypothetical protein
MSVSLRERVARKLVDEFKLEFFDKKELLELVDWYRIADQILALISKCGGRGWSAKELKQIIDSWWKCIGTIEPSIMDYEMLAKALATPTFSGEKKEKPFPISKCCNASVKFYDSDNGKPYYRCESCGNVCDLAEWNKEPKPKDRIEELLVSYRYEDKTEFILAIRNKINEIIHFINNRKE